MSNLDAFADWIAQRDHYGTLQPVSIDHIDAFRVTTEWTDLEIEFPPAPPPPARGSHRSPSSREAHLREWLDAVRDRGLDPGLARYLERQLGLTQRCARKWTMGDYFIVDDGEFVEWEEGDFIPPPQPDYKAAAKNLPRQVDLMHWLQVMDILCGLDDDLTGRLGSLRSALWAG